MPVVSPRRPRRDDASIQAFQVLYDADKVRVIGQGDCAPGAQHRYLERIGAILQFASLRLVLNRPIVIPDNGKHRFVMRVDDVSRALDESVVR